MSLCSIPTATTSGYNLSNTAPKELFPQLGQGIYCGVYYPGSTKKVEDTVPSLTPTLRAEVVIQNDTNYISSLTQAPQNVLRMTGQNGVSYIQGSNIGFALPYNGNVGVRVLPSTGTINVANIGFVSSLSLTTAGSAGGTGTVNMTQLVSSIKGYGWANVS